MIFIGDYKTTYLKEIPAVYLRSERNADQEARAPRATLLVCLLVGILR